MIPYALVLLCTLATPCEYGVYHQAPMTQAQCEKARDLALKNTPLQPFCVPYAKGKLIK
jgi:hypothetical protein